VIDVAWLGVQAQFQSETDHDGNKLADRLYAYIEEVAREHSDTTEDMPVHLVCDERNGRGLRFWERNGFEEIGRVTPPPEDVTYVRMIRA
jgi:GNAT superfamily N-acetyltransferase